MPVHEYFSMGRRLFAIVCTLQPIEGVHLRLTINGAAQYSQLRQLLQCPPQNNILYSFQKKTGETITIITRKKKSKRHA